MKYSPENLTLLKAQVQEQNKEVEKLVIKKETLLKNIETLKKEYALQTKKNKHAEEAENQLYLEQKTLQEEIAHLNQEKENLTWWLAQKGTEYTQRSKALTEEIDRLVAKKERLESETKTDELHAMLDSLREAVAEIQEERDTLTFEVELLFNTKKDLRFQLETDEEKLDNLGAKVSRAESYVAELAEQRSNLLAVIDDIKVKERDVNIMHQRMSKEYREAYKRYRNLD